MDPIRILHASDLHIASISKLKSPIEKWSPTTLLRAMKYRAAATSFDPTLLQAFADFVRGEQDLDAIMLTGDLATTGEYRDLVKAFQFIEGRYTSLTMMPMAMFIEPSLAGLTVPIFLLPGNHDRFLRSFDFFNPGGTEFHNVFSKYWEADVRPYPVIEKGGLAVAMIGADFSLRDSKDCGRWLGNKYAQGKVYDDILESLIKETMAIEVGPFIGKLWKLWAIHFPPQYPGISARMKLLDSEKLINAANACGIDAMLTGHTHKQLKYSTRKMKFDVLCAGTPSEYKARYEHHFQIITFAGYGSPAFQVEHYEYDRRFSEFRPVATE